MLDPERVKLTASTIGFLQRTGQKVDYETIRKALQTSDDGCANVRREKETAVNELHVMGGQRMGMEGNQNLLENARQERRMNGYPLRSFSADEPAIILPPKYGGFPQYVKNEVAGENFVSRFTAPLSAPLQQNTILLATQGYEMTNESASDPYTAYGFEHNLHKSAVAIDYNDMVHRQRQWLKILSQKAKSSKGYAEERGVFVSADGDPMTQVEDAAQGAQDTNSFFRTSARMNDRRQQMMYQQPLINGGGMQNNSINPNQIQAQFVNVDDLKAELVKTYNDVVANQINSNANLQSFYTPKKRKNKGGMQPAALNDFEGSPDASNVYDGGSIKTPRQLLMRSPAGGTRGARRRRSMLSATKGTSNRSNEILGYAVREARERRTGIQIKKNLKPSFDKRVKTMMNERMGLSDYS